MTETQTAEAATAAPPTPARKALVIDDYYARPTSAEVRGYTNTLRQFITDNPKSGVKEWLDTNFGLSGDHKRGDYFDPVLDSPASVQSFWRMRDQSPIGERLSTEILADLVGLLEPAHNALRNIESQLQADGWQVHPFAALPEVDSVDADVALIAIDYILVPGEPAQGLERSMDFLRNVLDQSKNSIAESCPFVLLMSANPEAEKYAETFRSKVRLHSPYFRFSKKSELSPQEVNRIVGGFLAQIDELESYRKLHVELEASIAAATEKLRKSVEELELQDLATLHAGQLVQEGEPLSDYVGWLYGQFLSTEMMQQPRLAERAASLPASSHRVLLGHLSATDNIPKLFSAVSLAVPASAAEYKAAKGRLQVRFGDLFAYKGEPPRAETEEETEAAAAPRLVAPKPLIERYLLVISQTCDLFHRNIRNGQVLCLDGDAQVLTRTEADLLRATIRQMNQQGRILHKEGTKYVEVEWRPKDVRTIEEDKLATENGFRYLGRLNELYALHAQHNALDELGRIGVPIQPSYSIYFKKLTLKVFEGANEIPKLRSSSQADMIVGVLRNEKAHTPIGDGPSKGRHRLLFSAEIRTWLINSLQAAAAAPTLPNQLKQHVDNLRQALEQRSDYSLIVKIQKETLAVFLQEKLQADGTVDITAEPKELGNPIAIELSDVFDSPARTNTRIELIFEKV